MTKTTDAGAHTGQDTATQEITPETPPSPGNEREPEEEAQPAETPEEVGGPPGPEPTRFGDWEKKGRCIDF
jgi:hypothetical protein